MPRHGSEDIVVNEEDFYDEFFDQRNVSRITHYRSPRWPPINAKIVARFNSQRHVWKLGDKYYKLAAQYYGDPKLWWAIAWYNQKPTEGHVKPGDIVFIPTPLGRLLTYFNMGSM